MKYERLASCSSTLWRVKWSSENQVEFGSGFVLMAKSNRKAEMLASKLTALKRPLVRSSRVMYLPVRGRKPWLAKVFRNGHGPRTMKMLADAIRHHRSPAVRITHHRLP